LEITPFQVKQGNQTQQQNEGKNKSASSDSDSSFGNLFANYLSKGPNTEIGKLSKEKEAKIDIKVEEHTGPVIKIPLPIDLIQTVNPYATNLVEDLMEEEGQTGLDSLNLVLNQLVYQNLASSYVDGVNTSSEEITLSQEEIESSPKLISNQAPVVIQSDQEIVFAQQPTITDPILKQNSASLQVLPGIHQTEINEMTEQVPTRTITEPDYIAQSQSPSFTIPNSSLETIQPEDQKQAIQESTPLVRKDFPLFGNDVAGKVQEDKITELNQNLNNYTTISRIMNQKEIFNESRKSELPIEENKGLMLDKSQIIGHQPLPVQVNNSTNTNGQLLPANVHINDFVPELQKWMSNIKIINENPGATEAKVSLFPKNLGHVEIKIMTVEGQLSAEIMTETLLAKDALEGQLPQLKQSLQQSGLVVQRLEILHQPVNQLNDMNQANLSFGHSGTSSSNEQRSNNTKQASANKGKKVELAELGDEIPPYGNTRRNSVSNIDFTA
jgi:flagellar hook-length control protein FliK